MVHRYLKSTLFDRFFKISYDNATVTTQLNKNGLNLQSNLGHGRKAKDTRKPVIRAYPSLHRETYVDPQGFLVAGFVLPASGFTTSQIPMATEQILKKEDGLILDKNRYFKRQGKGGLTLTPSKLSFISQNNNELFLIPLSNILNVRAEPFMKGYDALVILFSEDNNERIAKVKHHPGWVAIGGFGAMERVREPYFKSWEKLIDETRLGQNSSSSTSFDDLEKLADLKDKGVITEEEFSAKKKQLLGI